MVKKEIKKYNRSGKLTVHDKQKLTALFCSNFNNYFAYKELYPDVDMATVKSTVMANHFKYSMDKIGAWDFVDSLVKEKFKNLFITKERVISDLYEMAISSRREGKTRDSISALALLSKLMGYEINRLEIDGTINITEFQIGSSNNVQLFNTKEIDMIEKK